MNTGIAVVANRSPETLAMPAAVAPEVLVVHQQEVKTPLPISPDSARTLQVKNYALAYLLGFRDDREHLELQVWCPRTTLGRESFHLHESSHGYNDDVNRTAAGASDSATVDLGALSRLLKKSAVTVSDVTGRMVNSMDYWLVQPNDSDRVFLLSRNQLPALN